MQSAGPLLTASGYRRDIDGLRAVAVILVLLFHLRLGVTGGYIGVDVFFVISGFLITGIINRQMVRGTFSFLDFYGRRARRILPALFVVLLVTSAVAVLLLLPSDLDRYAKSLLAALLSVSNFWFWSQGGYFGFAPGTAPLLHTWSLGVEEQFYIFLPIALLWLQRRAPRHVAVFITMAAAGSFLSAAFFVSTRTPEVFYFSPFRAWELLLGGSLALWKTPPVLRSFYRQLIAVGGLLLVIVPAWLYTPETLFPGPAAALPCLGAATLLWVGASGDSLVRHMLASRPMVFIGLISYSLYLWHWPILVLATHVGNGGLTLSVRVLLGVLAFFFAWLSWKFIETPFRTTASITRGEMFAFSGMTGMLLAVIAATVILKHGLPARFEPEIVALDQARSREVIRGECIDYRVALNANSICRIGATGTPTVLVWGDSYAHAMLPAFDAALKNLGFAAYFVAESGCPPVPATRVSFRGRDNWRCRESNQKVMRFISDSSTLKTVVLAGAWDSYTAGSHGYDLQMDGGKSSVMALKWGLNNLIFELRKISTVSNVVFVEQTPSYDMSVPEMMLQNLLHGTAISPMTRNQWLKRSAGSRMAIRELIKSGKLISIDPTQWLCATGICHYADSNNQPFYWDAGHLNIRGARFITPPLESAFRSILLSSFHISTQVAQ